MAIAPSAPRRAPSPHTFHIPVMGTGFTVDTPLRVARYGISSVISIGDDVLLEQMRAFHAAASGEAFVPIPADAEDARARRITAYLDLVGLLVTRQVAALQAEPFAPGSDIDRYFQMLPSGPLRTRWESLAAVGDPGERVRLEGELRAAAVPGQIDVNILTKADGDRFEHGVKLPPEQSFGMSSLRGYAQSQLASSVVFSAGMNPRLYRYAAEFPDFLPDADGIIRKQIILKVSDFRSALVQGKFLAKRGLWVSEYRIESGLNCGGHTFATNGYLLGPILAEFAERREELRGGLLAPYAAALADLGRPRPAMPPSIRVTVQGGIGTPEENSFLHRHYGVDGTGWGTPFLLVPEVTNVDDEHRAKLAAATSADVYLSNNSPFGVPIWSLRTSASEEERQRRIDEGKPGSPCPKGYLVSDTEFTNTPICHASRGYQKRRLAKLAEEALPEAARAFLRDRILSKTCLCRDLATGATGRLGIEIGTTTSVCCGPGIVDYDRTMELEEMVDHIYGRRPFPPNPGRPHMFLRELALYVDYLRSEIRSTELDLGFRSPAALHEFRNNLLGGVAYYRQLAGVVAEGARERFRDELERLEKNVESLAPVSWLEARSVC